VGFESSPELISADGSWKERF